LRQILINFDLGSFIFFHKFFLLSTPSLPPSILKYSVTQKEERLRENMYNVPNQNSLGSASRRASTERRKTKKNLFSVFYAQ
jgi:hypothetical protein